MDTANHFIDQCVVACTICFHHNGHYLWEHPEEGDVAGEHPGSFWQWPSIFGAETPKPTRFLSTIKPTIMCWFKWPSFSVDHKYLGPLPKECGHVHQKKFIGKTATGWATSPSAAYPAGLCEFLATLILSARCLVGGGKASSVANDVSGNGSSSNNSAVGAGSGASLVGEISTCDDATLSNKGLVSLDSANTTLKKQSLGNQSLGDKVVGSPPSVDIEGETGFDMAACKNHRQPISVEWDSKSRFFLDGFGLCSPTRCQPWDRGVNRSPEAKALLTSIYSLLLQEVVSSVGDPGRVSYELVLGRLKASPFPTDS